MAINLTWPNIFALVGLASAVLTGLVAGTGGMMEWRIKAVQHQLDDRMTIYQHEIDRLEKRLDALESKQR